MSPVALGALRRRLPDVLLLSDDLQMEGLQRRFATGEACRRGLAAGLDLLLIGNAHGQVAHEALEQRVAGQAREELARWYLLYDRFSHRGGCFQSCA